METLVLNTQKNPYLNQATPKKYLPQFAIISNPPKFFDLPFHLKYEVRPWGHYSTLSPCQSENDQ